MLEEAVELILAFGFIIELSEPEPRLIAYRLANSLSFMAPVIDVSLVIGSPILAESVITLLVSIPVRSIFNAVASVNIT